MSDFTFWDVVRNLLTGLQWTLALSLVAFIGGGVIGLLVMVLRISKSALPRNIARTYIELFQGTPLLMQLFLVFFGVALAGVEISPWMAAAIALTLFTSAYLAEIWRGCVDSISNGQWVEVAGHHLQRPSLDRCDARHAGTGPKVQHPLAFDPLRLLGEVAGHRQAAGPAETPIGRLVENAPGFFRAEGAVHVVAVDQPQLQVSAG